MVAEAVFAENSAAVFSFSTLFLFFHQIDVYGVEVRQQ